MFSRTKRLRKGIIATALAGTTAALIGVSIHSASAAEENTPKPTFIDHSKLQRPTPPPSSPPQTKEPGAANPYTRGCSAITRCRD